MTFSDRQGNNLNRKKLTIIEQTPTSLIVDVERADSDITDEGTPINAKVFTDFQNEIDSANEKATGAVTTAGEAKTLATSANTKADEAINTANTASANINVAVETANTAKSTAEGIESKIPTKTSQLENDSGFLTTQQDIDSKLEASNIIAGTNITLTTDGNNVTINSNGVTRIWQGTTKLGGNLSIQDGNMSRYKCFVFVTTEGAFLAHCAGSEYNPDTRDGDYNNYLICTGVVYNYTFEVQYWEFYDSLASESGFWTSKMINLAIHSGTGHTTQSSTSNLPYLKAIYGVL